MELGKFILLIHRKLTGDLKKEEERSYSEWLSDEEHQKTERDIQNIWTRSSSYKKDYQPDLDKSWDAFSAKLAAEKTTAPPVRIIPRQVLSIAAAVLLILTAAAIWWSAEPIEIVSTAGEEMQSIILPDATKVTLNQHSTLSFSRQWEGQPTRKVQLSGEAYFEVTPDTQQPFQIETAQARITVLGTTFNLRAYPNEHFTEIAVTEGQVQLTGKNTDDSIILHSNEMGLLEHPENKILNSPRSVINAQSWRTNELSFRDTPMAEIVETLERHFHVDIRFENVSMSRCSYTSNFSGAKLDEILNVLEVSLNLTIEQTGKESYLFSGGNCGTQ